MQEKSRKIFKIFFSFQKGLKSLFLHRTVVWSLNAAYVTVLIFPLNWNEMKDADRYQPFLSVYCRSIHKAFHPEHQMNIYLRVNGRLQETSESIPAVIRNYNHGEIMSNNCTFISLSSLFLSVGVNNWNPQRLGFTKSKRVNRRDSSCLPFIADATHEGVLFMREIFIVYSGDIGSCVWEIECESLKRAAVSQINHRPDEVPPGRLTKTRYAKENQWCMKFMRWLYSK